MQAESVTDGGLEMWPQAGSAFNIGIMLFRQGSLAFAQVLPGLEQPQGG